MYYNHKSMIDVECVELQHRRPRTVLQPPPTHHRQSLCTEQDATVQMVEDYVRSALAGLRMNVEDSIEVIGEQGEQRGFVL